MYFVSALTLNFKLLILIDREQVMHGSEVFVVFDESFDEKTTKKKSISNG